MRKSLLILSIFVISGFCHSQNTDHKKHTVVEGESLYGISKKYNVSVAKLIELNPQVDEGIKTGMELAIPSNSASTENHTEKAVVHTEQPAVKNEQVVVAKTPDTVGENKTSAPTSTSSSKNTKVEEHTVVEGETYYSLSRKYKTTVSELKALNADAPLKVGDKIVISKKEAVVEAEKPVQEAALYTETEPSPKKEAVSEKIELLKNDKEATPVVAESQEKPKETKPEVKVEKSEKKTVLSTVSDTKIPVVEPIAYDNAVKRILIIPFDPYLYFSDADMEIAKQSKLEHTKIRQAFRRRLNALLEPQGYETIHLLGGRIKDSLTDLNKIYKNVSYNYQDALYNPNAQMQRVQTVDGQLQEANKNAVVADPSDPFGNSRASLAKDESKYYGVKVSDPNFFPYFNNKYKIDYYIFVNQFEVKTNYATCLDRTTKNYERNFITHFSIFDNTGKQIAGNRIKIYYESNENNIQKILTDNMQKVATQIIGELPSSQK